LPKPAFDLWFLDQGRRDAVRSGIALSLSIAPERNARRCHAPQLVGFWVRGFFAGIEIRVLFEWQRDAVLVWNVARAGMARDFTE
jgi:hypothetical protein